MGKIKKESEIRKKCLIFGLEDVLIPGKIEPDFKMKAVFAILKNLKTLEKKFPRFRFFAISGYSTDEAVKRIEQFGLKEFFPEGRLFTVNKAYLESKEEVDKTLYEQNIQKNPEFKDEYFKQVMIEEIAKKFNYEKEEMILIAHDIWTEGYYTKRYSRIDFAIIKSAQASNGEKKPEEIKKLVYINRAWGDVEKLIRADFPKPEYAFLEAFVLSKMKEKLFEGTNLGALSKIAK